jgi:hypothetical protein
MAPSVALAKEGQSPQPAFESISFFRSFLRRPSGYGGQVG